MYLFLGRAAVVPAGEVIGVFDLDNVTARRITRDSLAAMEARGALESVGGQLPVSLVLTDKRAYFSPVSAAALGRRLAEDRLE